MKHIIEFFLIIIVVDEDYFYAMITYGTRPYREGFLSSIDGTVISFALGA